jgi:hypothetical protein
MLRARRGKVTQLDISPIESSWAEKRSSAFMVKTTVRLDVASKGGLKGLTYWGDPIQNGAFQAFGVIGPCAGSSFVDLLENVSIPRKVTRSLDSLPNQRLS